MAMKEAAVMCGAMMAALGGPAGSWPALVTGAVAAVLLTAAVALVAAARRPRPAALPGPEHPAVGLLKDRLARGEIDAEEFERRVFILMMYEPPR
jgi:putative membrane protein